MAQIQEFATKQRVAIRYNTKVKLRAMKESDMVLKGVMYPTKKGKIFLKKEGPYWI